MRCNGTVQPIVTGVKKCAGASEANMSACLLKFWFPCCDLVERFSERS